MGSVSNSLTSTANQLLNTPVTSSDSSSGSSSSSNPTGIFTGTSAYSDDFQNVISRAVAIASMPIDLLTNQQTALNAQATELSTLDTKFTALQTAVQGIASAIGGSSYQSTSTQPTAVTATLGDGAVQGVYNIEVDNPGAAATSLTTATWNQPALAAGQTATYGLTVGNQEYTVTTSDNSAQGVAAAIEQQCGSVVNALAVNVGNNDWRLSLQSPTLGPVSLNLLNVPTLQSQNTYAISQTTSDWVSTTGAYNLVVNGKNYAFTATGTGSAADIAGDINTLATTDGLSVTAAVVGLSGGGTGIQLVGTAAGAMTLDITNSASESLQTQAPASSETTTTWNAAADAPGTQSQYTLDVGSASYNFTVGDNSAQTVAAAINAQFGSMVTATVVDWSGNGSDLRIALQAKTGTSSVLDLEKTTNLQTPNPASTAGYAVSQTAQTWVSTAGSYNLVVNGTNTYAFNVGATDSATAVANAINSVASANSLAVNATAVNLGTASAPDYRIELTGTSAAIQSLNIQSPGSVYLQAAATSITGATWNSAPDASNTQSQYTLVVNGQTYNFIAADNSAASVAAAINSLAAANKLSVNATVVDFSGNGTDLRVALQDETGGSLTTLGIQKATANSLQTAQTTGVPATYRLDGAAQASSNTASINVGNGVTLNLLAATTGTASVTVTQSSSALGTALSAFADAYNACVDEIDNQRGQSAGPLQGQAILSVLTNSLSSMSLYGASCGSISTLHDLGLDLGPDGHLTYNANTFLSNSFSDTQDIDAFLGSAPDMYTSLGGSGFLLAATNALNSLEDPTNGLLKSAETDVSNQVTSIGNQITTKQAQVDTLQQQLTNQMAQADAAIASMEQQYSYISNLLDAEQTADQMYKS